MTVEEQRERGKYVEAIFSIRPDSEFQVGKTYDTLIWHSEDQVKPTEAEFDEALASEQLKWDAQEYARDRRSAFPSIGDQLDMQYHDQLDGTTTWKDAVAKVKSDNPKPE